MAEVLRYFEGKEDELASTLLVIERVLADANFLADATLLKLSQLLAAAQG